MKLSIKNHFLRSLRGQTSKFWFYFCWILSALYIISPIDLIPDFIPIVGLFDDLGLMAILTYQVLGMIRDKSKKKHEKVEEERK